MFFRLFAHKMEIHQHEYRSVMKKYLQSVHDDGVGKSLNICSMYNQLRIFLSRKKRQIATGVRRITL